MLVNKFKLRQDVQAYHLGGMGCGNGVMALGLIKDLLQVRQVSHPRDSGVPAGLSAPLTVVGVASLLCGFREVISCSGNSALANPSSLLP